MSIYTPNNHRKIYEQHHGPIPKDHDGRSYEIHHIDGNHHNNNITNLKLVTIQEHYNKHYSQGDWGACLIMFDRMKISPEEKSRLASKHSQARLARGDHPFLRKDFQRNTALRMVREGTNPFLGGEIQRKSNKERRENGTHHLLGNTLARDLIAQGRSPTQKEWSCSHCKITGKGLSNYSRWHGDNCRALKSDK
jgi:hypothetical protein